MIVKACKSFDVPGVDAQRVRSHSGRHTFINESRSLQTPRFTCHSGVPLEPRDWRRPLARAAGLDSSWQTADDNSCLRDAPGYSACASVEEHFASRTGWVGLVRSPAVLDRRCACVVVVAAVLAVSLAAARRHEKRYGVR